MLLEPVPLAGVLASMSLAQVSAADTLVAVAAPTSGFDRWVELLTGIATIVIAVALIVIAIGLIAAALGARKAVRKMSGRVGELRGDVQPIIGHATDVMENVNYVSSAIRQDVERLQATVRLAQERLDRTAEATEKRISDFNALLEIVQQEAEDLFIGTASTVRGVRAGSETYRRLGERREDEASD